MATASAKAVRDESQEQPGVLLSKTVTFAGPSMTSMPIRDSGARYRCACLSKTLPINTSSPATRRNTYHKGSPFRYPDQPDDEHPGFFARLLSQPIKNAHLASPGRYRNTPIWPPVSNVDQAPPSMLTKGRKHAYKLSKQVTFGAVDTGATRPPVPRWSHRPACMPLALARSCSGHQKPSPFGAK